jgi:flavin-dependent dehydrogenase
VGYAWIFPLNERSVKVGIGGLNIDVEKLEAMLQDILNKYSLKGKIVKREGAPIDMGGLKPEWGIAGEGGPYVVGEAIGAVMPITGEGIRPSVITAHTLATSLDMNHDYVKMLSKLNIYKASRMQRKLLERVAKNGASLPFKERELSPKTIELIYKLGMGEIGFKELLSLASKIPWLLKDII